MNVTVTILYMMIIGAIIGGYTNSLAIKMLFRPYRAIYIGKWKLPFTPGLIPKRRDELAVQLGKMVVEHLITPDSLKKKLLNDKFQKELTLVAQAEVEKFLLQPKTVEEWLIQLGVSEPRMVVRTKLSSYVDTLYTRLISEYRHQPIRDSLPIEFQTKAKEKIPQISAYILQKGKDYFHSVEGQERVDRMLNDFVREKGGMLGNMLQMFLGNVNLAEKVRPEIIKFLGSEGTMDLVTTLLEKEWEKLLDHQTAELEQLFGEEKIRQLLNNSMDQIVPVDSWMDSSLVDLTKDYRESILERVIPQAIRLVGDWASSRMEMIVDKLHLAEIVREQVETFSVERLEEMVLSITASELKMITYLGALLGGVIGIFQGIISVLMN